MIKSEFETEEGYAEFQDKMYKSFRKHKMGMKIILLNSMIDMVGKNLANYEFPSIRWWNDLFDLFTEG